MKKILGIAFGFALMVAGIALTTSVHDAHANTMTPPYVQWETLNTAAGAQIQSPVLTTTGCDDLEILADNSAGGVTRTLNISWLGSDGTTILYQRAITVTNGTRSAVSVTRYASAQSAGSGETIIGQMMGSRMQATLLSGGAANGSLAVYCR